MDELAHSQHTLTRLISEFQLDNIPLLDKSNTIQINRVVTDLLNLHKTYNNCE